MPATSMVRHVRGPSSIVIHAQLPLHGSIPCPRRGFSNREIVLEVEHEHEHEHEYGTSNESVYCYL